MKKEKMATSSSRTVQRITPYGRRIEERRKPNGFTAASSCCGKKLKKK